MKKFHLIDLFSGAGGMTLGFVGKHFTNGFESVLAVDNDRAACATYNANFGHNCLNVNIENWLETAEIPKADVVIGGPPCQGFSLLNKKRNGDVRRELWEPYMDIVERSEASIFVMENVPELLRSQEYLHIKKRAEQLGFSLHAAVFNMADYGVPQLRKRAIVIGWKHEEFTFGEEMHFPPPPTHNSPADMGSLPRWRTVKEVIADLPEPVGTEIREESPPLNLHFGRSPTKMSMERYRAVPPGGNRFDLHKNAPHITPQCWIRKKTGGTDLFGRLWWDRPSVTIRTEFFKPEKGRYLHPEKHRPITHREAARIMTFPDDFQFKGTKIEIARQIGNAVPPMFAARIGEYVYKMLRYRKKRMKAA